MTDDLSDIKTWIHAPEGRIIIGLTTLFVSVTLFNSVILPRSLPVERLERQVLSDQGGTRLVIEGATYLCNVTGLGLVGFKFLVPHQSLTHASPIYRGVACWNFGKSDWEIKLSQP